MDTPTVNKSLRGLNEELPFHLYVNEYASGTSNQIAQPRPISRVAAMKIKPIILSALLMAATSPALAWNKPGHMLSVAPAYQILRQESPDTIANVRTVLSRHPWFASRWQARMNAVQPGERDQLLFMLAARWADDARSTSFHHGVSCGTPKGHAHECVDLTYLVGVPAGCIGAAKHVADRRMVIAGYRLAEFLKRANGRGAPFNVT